MSQTKFTPGPWAIEQYAPNEQVVDENTHYGIVAGTTSVATLIELSEETEANAKLIAAAPDMLSALQQIVKGQDGETKRDFIQRMICLAEEVIEKATT